MRKQVKDVGSGRDASLHFVDGHGVQDVVAQRLVRVSQLGDVQEHPVVTGVFHDQLGTGRLVEAILLDGYVKRLRVHVGFVADCEQDLLHLVVATGEVAVVCEESVITCGFSVVARVGDGVLERFAVLDFVGNLLGHIS